MTALEMKERIAAEVAKMLKESQRWEALFEASPETPETVETTRARSRALADVLAMIREPDDGV